MNGDNVNENSTPVRGPSNPQQRMYAKSGEGRWYAILPGMEVQLRKAGADVCDVAAIKHVNEVREY